MNGRPSAAEVVTRLAGRPASLNEVSRSPDEGGIPEEAGLYAWWVQRGAIPEVPFVPHPTEPETGLLYVGISPRDEQSSMNLRDRVVRNHIGGNTGSSTLRFVLASLLMEGMGLKPLRMKTKVVLSGSDNSRLRDWQVKHLRLTWCEREAPWKVELEVIRAMRPPLNSRGNSAHEFRATVASRRAAFREAALSRR